MNKLLHALFSTEALKICEPGRPFWYTSGAIGPYYINTHFLCGSESRANELLAVIDAALPERNIESVEHAVARAIAAEPVYKMTVDTLTEAADKIVESDGIDAITGGERRDWFFSIPVARALGVQHTAIFKDMTTRGASLEGRRALHVADLINVASSYERAWVPAVEANGGRLVSSLVVVDRMQGGDEVLGRLNVANNSLLRVDRELFEEAASEGHITPEQRDFVLTYLGNPDAAMREFLAENPEFLADTVAAGGKNARRAELDYYGLL